MFSIVSFCPCTLKHSPLHKRSGVIMAASCWLLYQFFWGRGDILVWLWPSSPLHHDFHTATFVCHLARCQGAWDFHALLGTGPRKSLSMQNTLLMFPVCMCWWWVFGCDQEAGFERKGWGHLDSQQRSIKLQHVYILYKIFTSHTYRDYFRIHIGYQIIRI